MIQSAMPSLYSLGLVVLQLVSGQTVVTELPPHPKVRAPLPTLLASPLTQQHQRVQARVNQAAPSPCQSAHSLNFLVFAGGPNPRGNEIALEKNVLYFQRTLKHMGHAPERASIFFANGNSGQASIRYLDNQGRQRFKVPQIPGLKGPATYANLQQSLQQAALPNRPAQLFFYFTGHGGLNEENPDNNVMYLWNNQSMSVRQFASVLDRMPQETSIVTMMAQCYSGSFANFVYEGGNPSRPLAAQRRCGFFATIKTLPSVGCTPAVNEADYRDYSSSFFAGLSGRSRIGKAVTSADYNQDGLVSYAEAHAFAKVDEYTTDLPISTAEAWVQERLTDDEVEVILNQPVQQALQQARPEQRYVVTALVKITGFRLDQSFNQMMNQARPNQLRTDEQKTYAVRIGMELLNITGEQNLRSRLPQKEIDSLDRLLECESGSWK